MSRLASLSTPTRRQSPSPSPSPSVTGSPATMVTETTHHRMLKLLIAELKSLFRTWDELVGMDGLKAGQAIVNAQTTMDNIIGIEEGPERESVGGHLVNLVDQRAALASTVAKLERLVGKLALLIDQAEKIYLEAWAKQPADFFVEPLWYTWTIKHFLDSLPGLLHEHVLHLSFLSGLATTISAPQTAFDDAKLALERWLALSRGGQRWEAVREWEELVDLEVAGYDQDGDSEDDEEEEEQVVRPKRKGKGGKR